MESEGTAIDSVIGVVFVLSRSTGVQVEVIPHAVGLDVVSDVRRDHIPILDDGLQS